DEHPVAGLSWYEAAAYAKFAGAELPTLFHWARAAMIHQSGDVAPASNFGRRGTLPVARRDALNGFGTYDMGGNVREWAFNATSRGDRFVLGGGWDDQPYQFADAYAQPPMDRSPLNGLRLARYAADTARATAARPVDLAYRDYAREPAASDEVAAIYRRLYAYDRTPLEARVDSTWEEERWTRQLVSFAAAYGGERMAAYVFVPKQGRAPYRTVVLFPGSNAIFEDAPSERLVLNFDFLLNSGRAVVAPVLKGTWQRRDSLNSDYQAETAFYRDHVVMWARDLGRTIDYLETREDLDLARLAYYGISWGGAMGGLMPAVEPRIKVNVLYVAGLMMQRTHPEVDPWNFIPRVTQPTIMLNGRYDFFFPLESSQAPMFARLGTPPEHKRHVVADGGHDVPRELLIKEMLGWLDRYQAP
ncbi:MAG TPA: SUMF1/EgtB/PvdO family nonheme iron enzyme, partial [Gemmatimonadales bacterium]|nr:SUMF1/EgtB/PvdO family nonheme iron enzyme [Gemmatimonadales bacterium]